MIPKCVYFSACLCIVCTPPIAALVSSAAFRSGAVMGFLLAGFGLLNLFFCILAFKMVRSGF